MSDTTFDPAKHEHEARERWGHTEQWRESSRRTATYGEAEWEAIRVEGDAIVARLAALLAEGADPTARDARAAVEDHRLHIARWFYDLTPGMHVALGEMYVADPRFTAWWDRHGAGLAEFVRAAIAANAAASGEASS